MSMDSDDANRVDDAALFGVGAGGGGNGMADYEGDDIEMDDIDAALLRKAEQEEREKNDDNAVNEDGTRERNLTLWEAAMWHQKVFAVLEAGSFPSDVPVFTERISVVWALFMFLVIIVSSVTVLLESYPQYQKHAVPSELGLLEVFSVVIFTFDMIVRFITIPSRLAFVLDIFNWIDLIAILPFYLEDWGGVTFIAELRMVRVLRLMRMLRVLRTKHMPALSAMIVAVLTSLDGLILFLALAGIALLTASTAAYYAERGDADNVTKVWYRTCPINVVCTHPLGQITPFQSIPDSFWWATSALSTVGFGDVETTEWEGKLVACLTMLGGVFIMAFPTMILSGNFDAARKFGTVVNYGWDITAIIAGDKNADSPRTSILKRLGWYDDDQLRRNEAEAIAAPTAEEQAKFGGTMNDTARIGMATRAGKRRRKKHTGPKAVGSFMYGNLPRYIYRDSAVAEHEYWYDPLLHVAVCDDGGPSVRVLWGSCGQKSLIQLTVVLDCAEARERALELVEAYDQNGRVKCDLGSGIELRHWSSVRKPADCLFIMRPQKITGAYRNSDIPLYFEYTGDEADLMMMSEDEVAELAISHLLGTSIHINVLLPQPLLLKRLAIVQQVTHHTRLQREMELIAKAAEYGGDLMAYIARPDLESLLMGVSSKVIVDPSLSFEDVDQLELEIVDAVLGRVREMRVLQVPKRCRTAIYNHELLTPQTVVYEFPMSLFQADEADEVEEDAIGYTHARMRGYLCRTFRLDIRMDNAPDDLAYDDDEDDADDAE